MIDTKRPSSIAGLVIGAVVVMVLLAALASVFLSAADDVATAVENSTWTNTTVQSLVSPLGLLIAVAFLLGFVGLALSAFDRSN